MGDIVKRLCGEMSELPEGPGIMFPGTRSRVSYQKQTSCRENMSLTSKITLGLSLAFTGAIVSYVHFKQVDDRQVSSRSTIS